MKLQKRRARCLPLVSFVVATASLGGCAAPKPSAKTPIATTRNAPVQTPQIDVKKLAERRIYASAVGALQFSPDGVTLASAGGTKKNPAFDNAPGGSPKVGMLNTRSLETIKLLPLPLTWNVVFSPDLEKIITTPLESHSMRLTSVLTGKAVWEHYVQLPNYPVGLRSSVFVNCLAVSTSGKRLVSCYHASSPTSWARCWSIEEKSLDVRNNAVAEYDTTITCAAFSSDDKSFVVGSIDNTIILRDAHSYKTLWTQNKYENRRYKHIVQSITFSPDGKTIATGNEDKTVSLWNAQNGALLQTIKAHSKAVQRVVFSPDSSVVASGADDGIVVLSSTRNGAMLSTLNAKHGGVTALTWAPDGKQLAAGYADGTVSLWRVR